MDERQEAEKIVMQLREAAKTDMNIATSLRTEAPATSMFWFKMAELMEMAAKTLESRMPVEVEMEGGGTTWWYVCGDCHGAVDGSDRFCRHCGRPLINQTIKQIMQKNKLEREWVEHELLGEIESDEKRAAAETAERRREKADIPSEKAVQGADGAVQQCARTEADPSETSKGEREMTQQERLERREARKRMTRIRNSWKRFDRKKPSKEDFLRRGIAAEIIREPVYELSEQDWETLETVFSAEYTCTLKLDDQNEVTITGQLLPVAHLTLRDRHFVSIMAEDGDTEYLKKRAREIICSYY